MFKFDFLADDVYVLSKQKIQVLTKMMSRYGFNYTVTVEDNANIRPMHQVTYEINRKPQNVYNFINMQIANDSNVHRTNVYRISGLLFGTKNFNVYCMVIYDVKDKDIYKRPELDNEISSLVCGKFEFLEDIYISASDIIMNKRDKLKDGEELVVTVNKDSVPEVTHVTPPKSETKPEEEKSMPKVQVHEDTSCFTQMQFGRQQYQYQYQSYPQPNPHFTQQPSKPALTFESMLRSQQQPFFSQPRNQPVLSQSFNHPTFQGLQTRLKFLNDLKLSVRKAVVSAPLGYGQPYWFIWDKLFDNAFDTALKEYHRLRQLNQAYADK